MIKYNIGDIHTRTIIGTFKITLTSEKTDRHGIK